MKHVDKLMKFVLVSGMFLGLHSLMLDATHKVLTEEQACQLVKNVKHRLAIALRCNLGDGTYLAQETVSVTIDANLPKSFTSQKAFIAAREEQTGLRKDDLWNIEVVHGDELQQGYIRGTATFSDYEQAKKDYQMSGTKSLLKELDAAAIFAWYQLEHEA